MQVTYQGEITIRIRLYALWDDGNEDTDAQLARRLKCSEATVRTYRGDYTRAGGVVEVDKSDLPLYTVRGIEIWCTPIEPGVICERGECEWYEECKIAVRERKFVACERPLGREMYFEDAIEY